MDTISVELSPRRVATITLARPERGNAINRAMRAELSRQLEALAANEQVRVVVLRAIGTNFCTGADMAPPKSPEEASMPDVPLLDIFERLDALPKPTIAIVQGACIGGAVALTACCDVVIAAENASFSIPEARLGFAPSAVLPIFVRALGYRNFRRFALSGEKISAREALRIGVVHQIYEDGAAGQLLAQIVDGMLRSAPTSVAAFKAAAARFAPVLSAAEKHDLEEGFLNARKSADAVEGLAALREKRPPSWYPPDGNSTNADPRLSAASPGRRGRIDIHHHFLPPALVASVQEEMSSRGSTILTNAMVEWSVDKSLEVMNKGGISIAMLSLSHSVWKGDALQARRDARLCNEFAATLKRNHPGRFGFFAVMPMPDVEGTLAEIAYALDVLKADGIGMMTSYGDKWPGDSAFTQVFAELDRRRAVIFFHPHAPGCCANLVPGVPDSVMEFPFDTTRAITSLLYNGRLAQCRNARLIFTHGGGTLPMLADRIAGLAVRRKDLALLMPDGALAEFRRLHFDVVTATNPGSMSALLKLVPPSQLLYGSDFPFLPPRYTSSAIDGLGFSADELRAIERENALQLLPTLQAAS